MSKQLYEEALAEVRQLKQIAEDNAKKAILDEVTPRIRQLIETHLVGEEKVDEDDRLEPPGHAEKEVLGDVSDDDDSVVTSKEETKSALPEGNAKAYEFKKLTHKLGEQVKALKNVDPKSFSTRKSELAEALKTTFVLMKETLQGSTLKNTLEEQLDSHYNLLLSLKEPRMKSTGRLREASLNLKIDGFDDEALDSDTLEGLKIEIVPDVEGDEDAGEESEELDTDAEEEPSEEMGKEETEEKPEEEKTGAGELELDLGGEESQEEKETKQEGRRMNGIALLTDDTVVEIDEGMLRREIARMKSLREGKVEGKSPVGKKMTPAALSSFGGGKDDGDPWLDGEVTTEGLEEMYEEESDVDEAMEADEAKAHGMSELDELVAELEKGSEEESEEETDEMVKHDMDEAEEDADEAVSHMDEDEEEEEEEETSEGPTKKVPSEMKAHPAVQSNRQPNLPEGQVKLNKILETRKSAAHKAQRAQKVMEAARKVGDRAAFVKAKAVYTEASKTYALATKAARVLSESLKRGSNSHDAAQTAALRKQLAETNLFNAKLLYTNKLLQNESLTPRQKVSVIEKLDEARSLREAKLVYESLVRTIASGKGSVNEGADRQVLGSASRATRPASTLSLNEGIEASRWAKLAGITK